MNSDQYLTGFVTAHFKAWPVPVLPSTSIKKVFRNVSSINGQAQWRKYWRLDPRADSQKLTCSAAIQPLVSGGLELMGFTADRLLGFTDCWAAAQLRLWEAQNLSSTAQFWAAQLSGCAAGATGSKPLLGAKPTTTTIAAHTAHPLWNGAPLSYLPNSNKTNVTIILPTIIISSVSSTILVVHSILEDTTLASSCLRRPNNGSGGWRWG